MNVENIHFDTELTLYLLLIIINTFLLAVQVMYCTYCLWVCLPSLMFFLHTGVEWRITKQVKMSEMRQLHLDLKMPVQVSINPTTGVLVTVKTFWFYSNLPRGHDKFQLIKLKTVCVSLLSTERHSSSLQVCNFQI